MLNTKSNNKMVYIYCPAGVVTGGVELLHQLCDILCNNGRNAAIVYYGSLPHEIPNDYKKYNIRVAEKFEDDSDNILVLPEVAIDTLQIIKNIRVIVWWLSVDNYFFHFFGSILDNYHFNRIFCMKRLLKESFEFLVFHKHYMKYSLKKIKKNTNIICHAYQCEYINSFLNKNGITNTHPLSDYINDDYVFYPDVIHKKENIVIYNPKKGYKFTKKLINKAQDLNWIPIQNMTRGQVKELMLKAKLYIDFGNFPGKDRMPREATMCGCCIITGTLGASGFAADLPIDEEKYKFNQARKTITPIIQKIHYILDNYETEINNFSSYRKVISEEKLEFINNILSLF